MTTIETVPAKQRTCPECSGSSYDRYPAPDGGPERCRCCAGAGTIPQAELAELKQWLDTLPLPPRKEDGPNQAA